MYILADNHCCSNLVQNKENNENTKLFIPTPNSVSTSFVKEVLFSVMLPNKLY